MSKEPWPGTMKVGELIEKLKAFDPESYVGVYWDQYEEKQSLEVEYAPNKYVTLLEA